MEFKATLYKFDKKGEKSGWTYIEIEEAIALKIKPGNKKSFRVKGRLDNYAFAGASLLPMGDGDFILPINGEMRKAIKKKEGDVVLVTMTEDKAEFILSPDLLACLADDKKSKAYFDSLAPSHQKYYSKWIESAKTPETKAKRIAQALEAFQKGMSYGEMIRFNKRQI